MAQDATPDLAPAVAELFRIALASPVLGAIVYALLAGLADDVRTMTLAASTLDDSEIEQIEKFLRERGMVRVEHVRVAVDNGTPN